MPPQLGSDLGNLKRLVERSRQTRRWETTAFSTSGGGTLHVPRQKSRGIPTTGGGEGLSIGTPPIGEIIRLGIHSHLGNGNEPVLFDTVSYRNGFNKAVVPSSQIELPHGAIYGIEGQLRWADGYTGGGVVTLLIDDSVYMTLPGFTSAWTRFSIATEFDAIQGQRLSIFVDHDDTTTDHDLEGDLVIATKEPLKEVVEETATFSSGDFDIRTSTASDTLNFTNTPNAGDLIVVMVAMYGVFTTSRTLNDPPGYTFRAGQKSDGGNGIYTVGMWSKVSDGTETSVTFTYTGGAPNRDKFFGAVTIEAGTWQGVFDGADVSSGSVSAPGIGRLVMIHNLQDNAISNVQGGNNPLQLFNGNGFECEASVAWDLLGTDETYSIPESIAGRFIVAAVGP